MKKIFILMIFMTTILTACEHLPAVVESKDFVELKENQAKYDVEKQKIIATTVAYTSTIQLKKLESENKLKETKSNNTLTGWSNFFNMILMIVVGIAILIGVRVTIAMIYNAIVKWFEVDESKHSKDLEYGLMSQKEHNRHKENMFGQLLDHKQKMRIIDHKHDEIMIQANVYKALIDKFGEGKTNEYIKEVDKMGKYIVLQDNVFLLEDKAQATS